MSAMDGEARQHRAAGRLRAALGWAVLWVVFTEGELAKTPWLALAIIAGATVAGELVGPRRTWRWRPLGALRFAGHFVRLSVVGGFDVARRALRRRMDIQPDLEVITLEADPETPARAVLAGTVSLIPGTLCADLEGRELTIHVIDRARDNVSRVRVLEARVAGMFAAPRREGV